MSDELELAFSVDGFDAAKKSVEDLQLKQIEFANTAKRLAREIADEEKKASASSGEAAEIHNEVLDRLRRQMLQAQGSARGLGDQVKQLEAAQRQAGTAAQQAQQGYSSLGAALGMAGQAVGRFNVGAGQMVSALGSTISQLPQLTAQFGPLGLAIGAANLAMSAWSVLDERERATIAERRRATDGLAESFESLRTSITSAREARERWDNALHGGASQEDREAAIARLEHLRTDLTTANQTGWGVDAAGIHLGGSTTSAQAAQQRLGETGISELGIGAGQLGGEGGDARDARLIALGRVNRMLGDVRATLERERSGAFVTQEQQDRYNASLAGASYSDTPTPTPTRRGGGSRDPAGEAEDRARAVVADIKRRAAERAALTVALNREQAEQERQVQTGQDQKQVDAARSTQEQLTEIQRQEFANRLQQRERELDQVQRINESFRDVERSGLQAVITAAQQAERAMTHMHGATLDSGRVWAAGMRGIGNDVMQAIGSDLSGALSSSVDAWLSGSKTFGEAALGMARTVTKSLTEQGIIKAISETAEGLGALATTWGVPNPSALLHFAAAGTWAAIAGVSGAVGAGIGAFGGGAAAGAQGGGMSSSRASMQPANTNGGGGGTTQIFVNVPNALMTNHERAAFIGNTLQTARRMGYRVAA
jgi:hypothetical protein